VVGTLVLFAVVGLTACGTQAPAMWDALRAGSSWSMRSSVDGDRTQFYLEPLRRWGCWSGHLIDLVDRKLAARDYWGPGEDVTGHQIMYEDADGSWRMVGTYTESSRRSEIWTMQVHGYPGKPTPYVITPSRRADGDTQTEYYGLFVRGAAVSSCMHGGPRSAPTWAQHVYWRSQFSFAGSTLRARYEENHECGHVACQVESWTFARGRPGINKIVDMRVGGKPLGLTLTYAKT
jgi:hypothetical protein